MLRLGWPLFQRQRKEVETSDFGRRFGWFVERDGIRIGELDYLHWDAATQFWHTYRLVWRRPEDAVTQPDAWVAAHLVLRNRRYTDVVVPSFAVAPGRDNGVIAVRGAYVTAERIRRG